MQLLAILLRAVGEFLAEFSCHNQLPNSGSKTVSYISIFFSNFIDMERTVKALDHVINYYMVSRELADIIQAGPHTTNTDTLTIYLEVCFI